ncbi:MAG TPA: hypothetical protein VNO70_21000 [Blastocatellia bacterium]|nr:hypothetical protein [Blastocatellia bacterium]
MREKSDHLRSLESLEALLADLQQALAEQGLLSIEDQARLEELRRQCAERREMMSEVG